MTIEDFTRRLGLTLVFSGLGVLVVALLCAIGGENATDSAVASLHHLFGLALAVAGTVMVMVGSTLASMTRPKSVRS